MTLDPYGIVWMLLMISGVMVTGRGCDSRRLHQRHIAQPPCGGWLCPQTEYSDVSLMGANRIDRTGSNEVGCRVEPVIGPKTANANDNEEVVGEFRLAA